MDNEAEKSDFDHIGIVEKIDFVLAFWMVHEVRNHEKFFEELTTILKPHGRILIIEPKIHVSKKEFNAMIYKINECGFTIIERPNVFFSRAVVLSK